MKLKFKHLFGLLFLMLMFTCVLVFSMEAKAATIERSGNCGSSAKYTLDSDGLLTITGTGKLWDDTKWYDNEWEDEIIKVVIQSGITELPTYCFTYCENMTSITLPSTITSIGQSAFRGCSSLKSISIPSAVTSIQAYTFENCSALTTVTLPTNLTAIGNYAFNNSGLTSITIPASVTEIGNYVFKSCASLTKITVNSSNPNYSSDSYGVLFNKQKTKILAAPGAMKAYSVPSTVTRIENYAFNGLNSLTSVTIPGTVKEIGTGAFGACTKLTTVSISAGVTTIEANAFNGCTSLANLTIPDGLTSVGINAFYNTAYYNSLTDGVVYFGSLLYGVKGTVPTSVTVRSGTKVIADSAFYNNSTLTSVTLPEGLERIGTSAFAYCSQLQSITIPSTVEYFGERIFSGCSKMTSAWIKSGVTTIGNEMFYRCTKLVDLTLPDSITQIGTLAFSYTGLTEFYVPAGLKSVGTDAFLNVSSSIGVYVDELATWFQIDFANNEANPIGRYGKFYVNGQSVTDITVPTSVTKINNYAFALWENFTSIKFHNGVTAIGDYAFYGYSKMTAITLPNSLKSIGKYAFSFARLTSVTIPDSVTEIGEWAFSDCNDLEYIRLPSGLKTIPEYMLIWCRNLRSITIPNSVTTISTQAFYGAGIQWITIPASVTQIGDQAFYYADGLNHVFYTGTETQWKAVQKGTNLGLPTYPHHYGSADSILTNTTTCSFDMTYCTQCQIPVSAALKQAATHNYISGVCSICGADQKWTYTIAYGMAGDKAAIEITGYSGTDANLVIPDKFEGLPVSSIGDSAFRANRKLVSVTTPSTLESIYGYAFYDCSSLKHIILPKSLTSVGSYAFYYCSSLSQVCFTGTSSQYSSLTTGSSGNTYLKNATWTYNAVDPKVQVNDSCVDTKYVCTCCKKTVLTEKKTTPTHDFAEATCTTPKTCKVCAVTEGEALGHSGDMWFEIVPASCTEEGIRARICAVCNETETVPIPANGHAYDSIVTAPTCTEKGYTTNTCSACGDVTVTDYVDAKGHSFGDWMEIVAPDCATEGVTARMCACGETETQPVAALGHSYDSVVTAPTCTEQGYTTFTCNVCGDSYKDSYVDAKGHSFGSWVQIAAPDCTTEGTEARTCDCGETETQPVDALGHSFGSWVQIAAPNCTTEGMEARTCDCGETETQPVAALGHKYEPAVTAPTCTEKGYTTNTCTVCGDVTVTDYVDAKGHKWSAWIQTKAPTCTVEGSQLRFCNCGTRETQPVEKLPHTYENGICSVCGALESHYWVLSADANVNLSLAQDLYVDLNGFDLSGTITTNGYQVYGMDSTTNTYSCDTMGYFTCVDENGKAIEPVAQFRTDEEMTGYIRRYMTIQTQQGYTFHRFYLGITNVSLAPSVTGFGYKAEFYGDEMVQNNITSIGFDLWVTENRVISRTCAFKNTLTLRLTKFDAVRQGEVPVNASATMTLADGTVIKTATHTATLRGMLEKINDTYQSFNESQLAAVEKMIEANPVMKKWNVDNLYYKEDGVIEIPIPNNE